MENFIAYEKEKANAFNIFTALLCQPDEAVLQNKEIYDRLKSSFSIICPDSIENCDLLVKSISEYKPLELLVEFTKLFIGPNKVLVQPYSCMYFGGKSLMSEETIWVINFYENMGLEFDNNKVKDAPDHVTIETEFNYYLTFNILNEIENNNIEKAKFYYDGQSEFFNKHYKIWIKKFCESIIENTQNKYYSILAKTLKDFVTSIYFMDFPKV